jgi:hypothetical protein
VTTLTDPVATATGDVLLLDRYLPVFDFTRVEHVLVDADGVATWNALMALDLLEVHTPLLDAAFWARGVPERLAVAIGRTPEPAPLPPAVRLSDDRPGLPGWLGLGTLPGREVAFGAVGRFWQPTIAWQDVDSPEAFAAWDDPAWGRIAASFSLRPYGRRTLLTYEARTAVPDPGARRRFARYWLLVRPFVGHIMRATLGTVREEAERAGAAL